MVSKAIDCLIKIKKTQGEEENDDSGTLSSEICQLKKEIQANRFVSIKEKLEKNGKNLESHTSQLLVSATSKKDLCLMEQKGSRNMLSFRIESCLCEFSGYAQGLGDKDYVNSQEVLSPTVIKLPYIEKIPPYSTWIFLDRNQRMAEDQSVVGRRRIYYDQYGSEALICSDSEEEIAEPEEEKHEFSEGEDQILWMAFQEHGLNQEVLNILGQFIGGTASEIQERYNMLKEKYREKHAKLFEGSGEIGSKRSIFLDKSLSAALDSFDNLFCRRCLVFDCRLHGCSQSLITPSEKQPYWYELEEDEKPCSDQCYLRVREGVKDLLESSNNNALHRTEAATLAEKDGTMPSKSEEPIRDDDSDFTPDDRCIFGERTADVTLEAVDSPEIAVGALDKDMSTMAVRYHENAGKRKALKHGNTALGNSTLDSDDFQGSAGKKHKQITASDVDPVASVGLSVLDLDLISSAKIARPDPGEHDKNELQMTTGHVFIESVEHTSKKYVCPGIISCDDKKDHSKDHEAKDGIEVPEMKQPSKGQVGKALTGCEWKPIEKELYMKGIEIFGRNSCLIARNLLSGLKTCIEVSSYMYDDGAAMQHRSSIVPSSFFEDTGKVDTDFTEQEIPTRSRLFRRRGRARKLKYSWKSTGHPSIRKRIADGKHQSCKQYTPCGCQSMCGKQCPCLHNGTCCEKYCGCSKSCKNRFRGCHCAKSQCRSRQCPCFAAGRECDPDVCRNCWVSCGDGSLGAPPTRGDAYQCGNMRLLLKQQQRILLSKSDVAGWGAFIKNPVNRNDYLGEYTGELISHREADKRGKIYDRANSSFLFDLNDQYVLDAYRKGDKLKFANHSSNPNCYAKVMLVAGDHRVGIFAKEHIEASEELFYDYRYGPDQAPIWARKPEGSKRDDISVSHGRAQKHQSH